MKRIIKNTCFSPHLTHCCWFDSIQLIDSCRSTLKRKNSTFLNLASNKQVNNLFRTSAKRILIGVMVVITTVSCSMVQQVFASTTQRNTAISTMASMRYFAWYPNGSVIIYGRQYAVGGVITGLPYTQYADTTRAGFISSPTMQYIPGGNFYSFSQPSGDVGNDCTSAVAISWAAGGSSINVSTVYTVQMLAAVKSAQNCMAKRGTYSTGYTYTNTMIEQVEDIDELYSALIPGDACFYRYYDSSQGRMRGHAILITGVNPATDTVTYIEQIGVNFSTNKSTWTSGTKTFNQLESAYYVPIRPTDI